MYLVRELYLGDRIIRAYRQFLAAREVSCRHTLRWTPFSSVLWPLAGNVRRINCSFISLALDIHVFCLRAEAEGAIPDASIAIEESAQNWTFHVEGSS